MRTCSLCLSFLLPLAICLLVHPAIHPYIFFISVSAASNPNSLVGNDIPQPNPTCLKDLIVTFNGRVGGSLPTDIQIQMVMYQTTWNDQQMHSVVTWCACVYVCREFFFFPGGNSAPTNSRADDVLCLILWLNSLFVC